MAKIYSAPDEFPLPKYDFKNVKNWLDDEKEYIAKIKNWCIERFNAAVDPDPANTLDYIGETISFPRGDGNAVYMVASIKPLQLIHLEIGDNWSFEYAHKLNAKEVKEKIDKEKSFNKFWQEHQDKKKK